MAKSYNVNKFLRKEKMPHIWCPGCGNGIAMAAFLRAVDDLKMDPDNIVAISGIGCSSRITGYLDFNTLHTTHGRALAFAAGIKLAKPQIEVIVIAGDGDTAAIGGNHFLHACHRNLNITTIVFNNNTYGMTGGQTSPMTPKATVTPTAPYGNMEEELKICDVAIAAGATYVARGATFYPVQLEELIRGGLENNGFSIIEIITQCPVYYGRQSKIGDAVNMLKWQKDNTISVNAMKKLPKEASKNKIVRGVLSKASRPDYISVYNDYKSRIKEL